MSAAALLALALLGQDGGTGFALLRGGELRLELTDARPKEREFPTEAVRSAIAKGFETEHIRLGSEGVRTLRMQLEQVEHRENDAIFQCARVRARIVERGKEFLPSADVVNERCLAAGPTATSYTPVPEAIRAALVAAQPKAEPYAIAVAEVLTVLERRLRP